MESPTKTEAQQGKESGQVERWVTDRERRHADALTLDGARAKYEKYMQGKKDEGSLGTLGGCALAMGFVSESGLGIMGQRGSDFASLHKEIVETIVSTIAERMLTARANQVGCIFYLKNRAGYRDKQPDEVAAENDDWLRKVQGFQAMNGQGAVPSPSAAAPASVEGDAAELLLFESTDDAQDAAAGG